MRPKERLAIQNKIKAVGRRQKKFNIADCMIYSFAKHLSEDWQEVLNQMVDKGTVIDHHDTSIYYGSYSLVGR